MENNNLDTKQISIRLDQYDDIFSDFDIRDYSKRALSVDFLEEIKRASYDKNYNGIEMTLHIPESKVNTNEEENIKDRLKNHFSRHYKLLLEEKIKIIKFGIFMVFLGVVGMIISTLIVFFGKTSHNLMFSFLVVFLEPASIFLLWEGMDQIIFTTKNLNKDLSFYRKMSDLKTDIKFLSY